MNCRQGDLAYVFKSEAGNYGRVVTCLEMLPAGYDFTCPSLGVLWRVDAPMKSYLSFLDIYKTCYYIPDTNLRPLRGDLSNDETDTTIIRDIETV